MSWERPESLPIALLLVGLAAACVLLSWARARRRARLLLGPGAGPGAAALARDLALVAALAAIAAAYLGPRVGTRVHWVPSAGVDVVLLLDVSRSMEGADVAPSRLARARRAAAGLLRGLGPGDRAALAVFASRGVLLTPLTPDREALLEMLPAVDGGLLEETGSSLAAGVAAAAEAFEPGGDRPRVLVVLSDGESPGRASGVDAAREAGLRVVALGFGTEAGARLVDGGVPLRDEKGLPVVSRRDLERLRDLADATGGAALAADRWGDVDLGAALAAIRRDAAEAPGELVPRRVPALRTVPLAAAALLLLWLEGVGPGMPARGRRRRSRLRRASAAVGLLAILGTTGSGDAVAWLESRLRDRPGDPALLLALGVARAEAGDRQAAARALEAAALGADDPELAALAYYDLGVLELDRGRYAPARDAFLDALALRPTHLESRFNLEWTLRALAAVPPDAALPEAEPSQADPSGTAPPASEETEPEPREATDEGADETREPDRVAPRAEPEAGKTGGRPETGGSEERWAPQLDEAEVERWLDAVGDPTGRALRRQAREVEASAGPPPGGPRW